MCNHYRASGAWRTLMDEFSLTRINPFADLGAARGVNVQGDDLYPGHAGEILAGDGAGRLTPQAASWCFMPASAAGKTSWAEWLKTRRGCNNARGEEADRKWPFVFVAKTGRCLIPAEAFFEWDDAPPKTKAGGGKTEYRFSLPDGRTFMLAGLCGRVEPADAGPMLTYTMITKAAGGDTAAIGHGRQPVMLSPDEYAAWLDPATPIAAFTTRIDPAGTFEALAVKGPRAAAGA
jgi:putative SOS response-associated peptidase YedK